MAPSAPPPAPGGARGPLIHVATRCDSLDDFVEKFASLASEGTLVLPASGELPRGTEARFVIRLQDQSVAMRGRCRVTDVRPGPPGGAARPTLLRVALLDMEEASAAVHRRLLARRRAAAVPTSIAPEPSDPTVVSDTRPEAPPARNLPTAPPISPLAATMIGPPPRARAGTSPLGVPRVSALAQPRPPGTPFALPPNPLLTPPPVEVRAPGAAFTLPANPLSEMDATQVASFIDSTLFESDDDDATAERPAPAPAEAATERTPAAPAAAPPSPLLVPRATGLRARWQRLPPGTRRTLRRIAPYAACVVAGLLLGRALRRTPPPAAPPAAADVPPAAIPAPAAPAPVEAPAPPLPAPAAAPREAAAAPPVPAAPAAGDDAAGDCRASVRTTPPEAKISWRGRLLGKSPLDGAKIPCGAGALTISHERYEMVTRTLTAEAGSPLAVSERLHRPPATLVVDSSPEGATISLNGHAVGKAPRKLPTLRYEHLTIRATLPGHAAWTKKVYLTGPTTEVTAQLGGGRRR